MKIELGAAVAVAILLAPASARADAIKLEATMSPEQQMQLDFKDGSGHFVLMVVLRQGTAQGSGPLAGAAVTEYGMHDITPGVGGEPRGYLVFADTAGDEAYIKWQVEVSFLPGSDGKPKMEDNGLWQIVSGTGHFKGLKGAGILHIDPVSATDRRYTLDGDMAAPK